MSMVKVGHPGPSVTPSPCETPMYLVPGEFDVANDGIVVLQNECEVSKYSGPSYRLACPVDNPNCELRLDLVSAWHRSD